MSETIRVLYAHPEARQRSRYRRALEDLGHEVVTAADAIACIREFRQFHPNVLVLSPSILWGGVQGVLSVLHEEQILDQVQVLLNRDTRSNFVEFDCIT